MMSGLFRTEYKSLSPTEAALLRDVKLKAEELEVLIENMGRGGNSHPSQGRYKALAITALEQSVMWAVKGITA